MRFYHSVLVLLILTGCYHPYSVLLEVIANTVLLLLISYSG